MRCTRKLFFSKARQQPASPLKHKERSSPALSFNAYAMLFEEKQITPSMLAKERPRNKPANGSLRLDPEYRNSLLRQWVY
jgi:hypothetical protein